MIIDILACFELFLIGAFTYVGYSIVKIVLPPANFPTNIPTIPFYVSFLGTYTRLDQEQIFNLHLREKLEKFGAVKIYFAGRWNILVTKPEYLVEVFKNELVYTKSGNQIKIPNSVLSTYTGDNIISAHGETWKLYRKIVAGSIQTPSLELVRGNCEKFGKLLEIELSCNNCLIIGDLLQRFTLQNVGESILGVDFRLLNSNNQSLLNSRIRYVKLQIFKPIYMNFPTLDELPIPSRIKAKNEVALFRYFFANLLRDLKSKNSNFAANRLIDAENNGQINLKQFIDNAIILMVAGHENPLLLILSLFYVICKNPKVQRNIQKEIDENEDGLHPYLSSAIYETLRMYPPLGQIINRKTAKSVILGGSIRIPASVYVGYNNFATGRDSGVWGEPDKFIPSRWGADYDTIQENYAQAKRSARLPAFHGWKRACLGEKFALYEVKLIMIEVLKNYTIRLDPNWEEMLTPAGPVCPLGLAVKFESRT